MQRAIYAYVPVVHAGVLTFFDKHPHVPIWILDNVCGKDENVYLERDMRALNASQIKCELEALGYLNIEVVNQKELETRAKSVDMLIVPQDEIIDFFLSKYAPAVKVTYDTTFLRWTKKISTTEMEIPPHRIITSEEFQNKVMRTLALEAEQSSDWWRQVAAMLIKEEKLILTTHNTHYPTPQTVFINGDPRSNLDAGQEPLVYTAIHAEAAAIAQAAREGVPINGSDIYVTIFPCPTCARLLVEAGIKRVYYRSGYSLLDAEEILTNANIEIVLVREPD